MAVSWIKLSADIFKDDTMLFIESLPDGYEIQLCWIRIICLAGRLNQDGLLIEKGDPITESQLPPLIGMSKKIVKKSVDLFLKKEMLFLENKVLGICNWNKYQSDDKLDEIRQKDAQRKRIERQRAKENVAKILNLDERASMDTSVDEFTENAEMSADLSVDEFEKKTEMSADLSVDTAKEEKSNKKEENKDRKEIRIKELYSDISGNNARARACEAIVQSQTLKNAVTSLFNAHFARYPYRREIAEVAVMLGKQTTDTITDDEAYLLEIAFKSAVKANARHMSYIQGCFDNFRNRKISTREQYDAEMERIKASKESKKRAQVNNPQDDPPSYGDSEAFFEAAVRAGFKD